MRKSGTDYVDKKTALGVGKARRRNTRPAKRLAHKVERREAAKQISETAEEERMGYVMRSQEEWDEIKRKREASVQDRDEKRRRFAMKIVTTVVDRINGVVIRPGPKPEERECYDVAEELRGLSPELIDLVADIIKVTDEEGR